jgi:hypothetical protein
MKNIIMDGRHKTSRMFSSLYFASTIFKSTKSEMANNKKLRKITPIGLSMLAFQTSGKNGKKA